MPEFESITALPTLAARPREAHKGSFGHVLAAVGSLGMSGAAVLCGTAALRGGAGTVQIAVPETIQPVVAAGQICCTTAGLPATASGQFAAESVPALLQLAGVADALALGPGLGGGHIVAELVGEVVDRVTTPMVIDADGLNALSTLNRNGPLRKSATILTPHPGEFGRLIGKSAREVQQDRDRLALNFAGATSVVLVLKGAGTIVTDGRRLYVNQTGNPGMATGGSGDVLTGLIAALLGQRLEPFAAAQLGVYLHGLAGDLACQRLGEQSLLATDLLHYLPAAFETYRQRAITEA
jgi:NAD(P)H-hydrate epimerase